MVISAKRSQLIWSPLIGWVLASCVISVASAQSETSSPARQTVIEQTPQLDIPRVTTSSDLGTGGPGASSTVNELGIAIGAFTLFPTLDVQVGYDNNVFATTSPATGSPMTIVRPTLELRSEWLNHQLNFTAGGGFGFYPAANTQNYQNYLLQVDGRLDIRNDFYVTGLVAVRRATEALGTPNATLATAPTVVDTIPLQLGLYQKFNRFFYQLNGNATRYWYQDNSLISVGGLPAASRNRAEFEEKARFGYEVVEDYLALWVSPGMNQIMYDEFVNVAGQQRDSRGWNVNFGATWKPGPKSSLEGYVGYQTLSYVSDGTSTGASAFGLTGSWNGYAPLVLRPQIVRTINQSAYSNYQNYVSTTYGVDFTYDIHDAWQAVGGISYNTADYTVVPGVQNVNPRTDSFWKGSIGLLYSVRPQVSVGPLYEHSAGWSTDTINGGPSYTRDMISIRLVARR